MFKELDAFAAGVNLTHGPCATGPVPRYIAVVPAVLFLVVLGVILYRLRAQLGSTDPTGLARRISRIAIPVLAAFGCAIACLIVLFFDCVNAPGGIGSPFQNSRFLASPLVSSTASVALEGHQDVVRSVEFSPDGRWLASSSDDKTLRLWDLADPDSEATVLRGHGSWVWPVAFGPGGHWLASGSDDQTVRIWDLDDLSAPPAILSGHEERVYFVAFSPNGQAIASTSIDGITRLWDAGDPSSSPTVLSTRVLAFSPDGVTLASADDDEILLWDLTDLDADPTIIRKASHVWDLAFSPDGQRLAACTNDDIGLWDVSDLVSGPEDISSITSERQVLRCVFSPDGHILASSAGPFAEGKGGVIHLWDVSNTDAIPVLLRGHGNTVDTLTFGPNGRVLVSGDTSGGHHIWNLADPSAEPVTLKGFQFTDWAFSPGGEILATVSGDNVIRLWNIQDVLRGENG